MGCLVDEDRKSLFLILIGWNGYGVIFICNEIWGIVVIIWCIIGYFLFSWLYCYIFRLNSNYIFLDNFEY